MAQVMFTSADDLLAAYLSGEIDHHSAQMLRQQIDAELSARMPARLILDFGGVTFMDSSGIGLILGRYRLLQDTGGVLAVQGVSAQIAKMLRLSGIGSIITLEGSANV